jgi:hypothetical protein
MTLRKRLHIFMRKYRRNDGERGRKGEGEISENLRDQREIKSFSRSPEYSGSLINAD